ncbi:hypothetical protein OH492_21715 [Vibrio chagasii]|nr:hypothetical protein [Vibrio chagasii]
MVPVYVANFIAYGLRHRCGNGGFPAHDQRDYEFATKYGIDIIPVSK